MAVEKDRNYSYKVLQDIDLSQNEIHNVSKIYNNKSITVESTDILLTDESKLNSIEITNVESVAKGNKFSVTASTTDISSSSTIVVGNDKSSIEITGDNALKIKTTGSAPITSEKLDSLNKENGSILESTQVNSYNVNANDVYFDNTFTGKDITIYWDRGRNSLVFAKNNIIDNE